MNESNATLSSSPPFPALLSHLHLWGHGKGPVELDPILPGTRASRRRGTDLRCWLANRPSCTPSCLTSWKGGFRKKHKQQQRWALCEKVCFLQKINYREIGINMFLHLEKQSLRVPPNRKEDHYTVKIIPETRPG